jgi:hypothetical protein
MVHVRDHFNLQALKARRRLPGPLKKNLLNSSGGKRSAWNENQQPNLTEHKKSSEEGIYEEDHSISVNVLN